MVKIGLKFRQENRYWPYFWSHDEPLRRQLWTSDGFVWSDLWLSASVVSSHFVANMEYLRPRAHGDRHFDSRSAVYRRNNPFAIWRALHLLAQPMDADWLSMPDKLVGAAVCLAAMIEQASDDETGLRSYQPPLFALSEIAAIHMLRGGP